MTPMVTHDFQALLMLFRNTSYRLLIEGIDYDYNTTLAPFIVVPKSNNHGASSVADQNYRPLVSDFYVHKYKVKFLKSIRDQHYPISKRIAKKHALPLEGVSILATMIQKHVRKTEGLSLDKVTLRGNKLGGAMLTQSRCQSLEKVLQSLNVKHTRLDIGWACIVFIGSTNMSKAANKYQALLNESSRRGIGGKRNTPPRMPTQVVRNKNKYLASLWGTAQSKPKIGIISVIAFILYLPAIAMEMLIKYLMGNTFSTTQDSPNGKQAALLHTAAHLLGSLVALGGYYHFLIKGTRYLFDLLHPQSITSNYLHTAYQYLNDTSVPRYLSTVNLSRFGEVVDSYIVSAYMFLGSEVFFLDATSNYMAITAFATTMLLLGSIPMLRYIANATLTFIMIVALTLPAVVIVQLAIIYGAGSILSGVQSTINTGVEASGDTGAVLEGVLAPLLAFGGAMFASTLLVPAVYLYATLRLTRRLSRRYVRFQLEYDLSWLK